MAKRKDEREEEQDQGTKAEHGIGRPDAEMEHRGTKADLGGDDDTTWLKDPKAELGGNDDTTWLKDPNAESANVDVGPMRPTGPADTAGLDVGPVTQESGDVDEKIGAIPLPSPMPAPDEGDPAAVVWPEYQEGPEMVDDDNDDADWAEEDAETEVDIDVETDEDVDTFEEVDDEEE